MKLEVNFNIKLHFLSFQTIYFLKISFHNEDSNFPSRLERRQLNHDSKKYIFITWKNGVFLKKTEKNYIIS